MSNNAAGEGHPEGAALQLRQTGAPPHFELVPARVDPVDGELVLRLLHAEVVPLDVQVAAGAFPGTGALPLQPGLSAVAEVVHGQDLAAGTVVCVQGGGLGMGTRRAGTFAATFTAPPECVVPLPAGLDPLRAALGVGSALTAVLVLDETAALARGETVLVLGASGGVGWACAQLAAARGARVLAAVRRPGSGPAGVTEVALEGLAEQVASLTSGHGADVIVDCVGGDVDGAIRCGALRARHVLVGYAAGVVGRITLPLLLLREHRLMGFNQFLVGGPQLQDVTTRALDAVARGEVDLPLGGRFGLHEAAAAYAAVGGARVVLEPR